MPKKRMTKRSAKADPVPPTHRQRECIRALDKFWRKHGRAPTFTELGEWLELSKAGAATLVRYCVYKGFIEPHRVVVELHVTDEGKRWL